MASIHRLVTGGTPPAEIAILVRMNAQIPPLEAALTKAGIAFRVRGQRFFERPEVRQALRLVRRLPPVARGTALVHALEGRLREDLGFDPDGDNYRLTREINGRQYVLEYPIHGDVALIRAERGDRWGNLTYRKAARNFGPVMATAARRTVASVHEIVELGALDPEAVVTPGIFVSAMFSAAFFMPPG